MRKIILSILLIGIIASISAYAIFSTSTTVTPSVSSGINYQSSVCVYKNNEAPECSHNLLYNEGKDLIKNMLGAGTNLAAFQNISLCNATAGCAVPVAAGNEGFTALAADAPGLEEIKGDYNSIGTGNWSINHTWTASGATTYYINSTRLKNQTGGLLAGNNFPVKTLSGADGDKLTVVWQVWVE